MLGKKLGLVLAVCASGLAPHEAPLPDPQALRQRAIASEQTLRKEREKYACTLREESFELNGDGSIKQKKTVLEERFYVNGLGINHVLERDGKTLTGDAAKKEQERTDGQVKKYSNAKKVEKEQAEQERQLERFLRALRFTNGRREARDGRSLVAYDLSGDPNFHPRSLEEKFAQAVTGRIWLDEESGVTQELKIETDRDVKLAGGLAANLHKGFQLHLTQQRQVDGVWFTKFAEGTGDARAALFLHERFRFRLELQQCHLYGVNADQKVRTGK